MGLVIINSRVMLPERVLVVTQCVGTLRKEWDSVTPSLSPDTPTIIDCDKDGFLAGFSMFRMILPVLGTLP